MVARIKNILIIFILSILFVNVSCTVTNNNVIDKKEYSITYICDGEIVEHNPSTYISGEETVLVDLEVEGFLGWYTNPNFSTDKIEVITETEIGDKTFYAKIEEKEETPKVDLQEVFNNMNNYSFTYSYESTDGEDYYSSYNEYDNGNFKQSGYDYYGDYFEDFLITVDDVMYIYTLDYDGQYVVYPEDHSYFDSYYSYFDLVEFKDIDASLFTSEDDINFVLKDTKDIDTVGKILMGDYIDETYTSLTIKVENGVVVSINTTSKYTVYDETYEYTSSAIFGDYNKISIKAPNASTPEEDIQTIEDVLYAFDDETVITKGYVNGIVGNNIYIQDNTGGVYIYLGTDSSVAPYVELGDEIKVEGIKTTYKGLVEIKDITSIEFTGEYSEISSTEINLVNYETLESNSCQLIDVLEVEIISLPSTLISSSNDVSIIISDGNSEVTLFVSKHLDYDVKQNIFSDTLKEGDKINIYNAVVGCFNSYQIVVTSFTTLETTKVNTGSGDVNFVTPNKAPENTAKLIDVIPNMGKEGDEVYGVTRGLPSSGNPQVLVIPIAFSDYPAPSNIQTTLQTAFFGSSNDTGWESLTSYYQKTSYGNLNINGTVLPAYNTGQKASYYESVEDGDYLFIKDALEYYDSTIDYSDYDYDKDGYIDGLYFVYTCPYSYDEESMYWAYTYEYYTDEYEYYDNVEADFYILASYEFLFDSLANGKKIKYNMETFIHETGHLLGLEDYYDYDDTKGPNGGLGGGDMMDYNIGDNNPFSKIILGWTTPYLVENKSCKITLNSFGSSGEVVLIPKSFNGTYFDEYYLVDFYTPDGLNELEKGNNGLFDTSGVRIYHIDATLTNPELGWTVWEIYKYNNSDTTHKLIKLIEADGNNRIENSRYGLSENSDLFQEGTSYTNSKWYDGTSTNFTVNIVNIEDTYAEIEIIIK